MAWTTPRTWTVGEIVTASLLNAHLRDNLSSLKTAAEAMVDVRRTTPLAMNAGAYGTMLLETENQDDWAGFPFSTNANVQHASAGRYKVLGNIVTSLATGTGDFRIRLVRYTSASVFVENVAEVFGPINGAVSICAEYQMNAGDFIQVQGFSNASGDGHSWTGRLCFKQISVL